MKIYGIVGYGGFSREVMPIAFQMLSTQIKEEHFELVFVEKDPTEISINGHRVMSEDDFLSSNAEKYFNIAIADFNLREKIAKKFESLNIKPFSIIASNISILSNNEIGEGAILCPFSTITSNAKIGRHFHCNIYSYVAHDCIIGDYVTFAPDVHCNGHVVIEDNAYIGTGAIIKHGSPDKPLVVGRGAIVGMGAVVTKDVPPNVTVVGNPAKIFERTPSSFSTFPKLGETI
jgi:sugar O-acyltransferase (sialic acid O-acetyltransferase NeuD family)